MKLFTTPRPFADPERAARRLLEHAQVFEPMRDGRIDIEQLNHPILFGDKATPAEYSAGPNFAVSKGWLELHERGHSRRSSLGMTFSALERKARLKLKFLVEVV